jgi:phospholipid/cholesterol/gamma-HCH transport system substrate-binding protein
MRSIKAEVISGVAIVVAFVVLVFGYIFLKNIALNAGMYEVYVRFEDASGLEVSDAVFVRGMKIGKVRRINLENLEIVVTLQLNGDVSLPNDSRVQIKDLGLMGEKVVDILPGKSMTPLKSEDTIDGSLAGGLMDMTGSLEGLTKHAEELLINLKSVVKNTMDLNTQENLKTTMANMNDMSNKLNDNAVHMTNTMANLDRLTENLDKMVDNRRPEMEGTISNIHEASAKFSSTIEKLDKSLDNLQNIMAKLDSEEGSAGKLINSTELHDNLAELVNELQVLAQDLKQYPQKYKGLIKVF